MSADRQASCLRATDACLPVGMVGSGCQALRTSGPLGLHDRVRVYGGPPLASIGGRAQHFPAGRLRPGAAGGVLGT